MRGQKRLHLRLCPEPAEGALSRNTQMSNPVLGSRSTKAAVDHQREDREVIGSLVVRRSSPRGRPRLPENILGLLCSCKRYPLAIRLPGWQSLRFPPTLNLVSVSRAKS